MRYGRQRYEDKNEERENGRRNEASEELEWEGGRRDAERGHMLCVYARS